MRTAILASLAAFALGFGLAYGARDVPPAYVELIATTPDGAVYVAGAGDSCAAAWEGAHVPADAVELMCIAS